MQTETTAQEQAINGVRVDRFAATLDNVKQEARLAKFTFRSQSHWMGGSHIRTTVRDFTQDHEDRSRKKPFFMEAGEPDVLLGRDEGPTPFEAVLHALASCLSISFIYHAAAQEVRIDELDLELQGGLDLRGFLGLSREVRNGFENLKATYCVKSSASKEKLDELCRLAQRRSPVFDVISNPVPVSVHLQKQ